MQKTARKNEGEKKNKTIKLSLLYLLMRGMTDQEINRGVYLPPGGILGAVSLFKYTL